MRGKSRQRGQKKLKERSPKRRRPRLGALRAGLQGRSAPVMVRPLITGSGDHSVPRTFPLRSWGGADRSGMLPSGPESVLRLVKPADLGLGWVGLVKSSQGQGLTLQPCSGSGGKQCEEARADIQVGGQKGCPQEGDGGQEPLCNGTSHRN